MIIKKFETERNKTIDKLEQIQEGLIFEDLFLDEKDLNKMYKELFENQQAFDELGVYIQYIRNLKLTETDPLELTLSKIYLVFQSVPKSVEFFNKNISEYYKGVTIDENDLIGLLDCKKLGLLYNPIKGIMFAKEIFLKNKYDKGSRKSWKSTDYIIRLDTIKSVMGDKPKVAK